MNTLAIVIGAAVIGFVVYKVFTSGGFGIRGLTMNPAGGPPIYTLQNPRNAKNTSGFQDGCGALTAGAASAAMASGEPKAQAAGEGCW